MLTRGSDFRCRKVNCIAVKYNTDLPDPANPFSHSKEFSSASHVVKVWLLTSHISIPRCFFAQAVLWLMLASGALNQSRIFAETWLALTKSSNNLVSSMSFWILLLSFTYKTFKAKQTLVRSSPISSSSLCKVLRRKEYVTRRAATLIAFLGSFSEVFSEGLIAF